MQTVMNANDFLPTQGYVLSQLHVSLNDIIYFMYIENVWI